MADMLVCTGKKKAVKAMLEYFKVLEKSEKITVIAMAQATKKAMIWNYEELKLLFERAQPAQLEIETKLIRAVDFIQLRQPHGLILKMSSFTTEDKEIRWNIISRTTAFQLRGGRVDIREEISTLNFRTSRICHMTISGPCNNVLSLREILVEEGFADPNTVNFIL